MCFGSASDLRICFRKRNFIFLADTRAVRRTGRKFVGRTCVKTAPDARTPPATILIINNPVNVTIVVLCNFALGPIFSTLSPVWSFILQTVLLTFLILLFGEILPKLYANSNNAAWAKTAAPMLEAGLSLFYPLSSVLVKSSGIVKKVVTKRPPLSPPMTSRRLGDSPCKRRRKQRHARRHSEIRRHNSL